MRADTAKPIAHNQQLVTIIHLFPAIFCILTSASYAYTFAGGTGEPNVPFQIATAEQLCSIGSDPNLLDKHYVLTADIDLDPNLPGGKVFSRRLLRLIKIQHGL